MKRRILLFCLAIGLACASPSQAQNRGGATSGGGLSLGGASTGAASGSSGMFGSRSFGSSISAGNRSFGGSSRGGVAGATQRTDSTLGQVSTSDRFVRGNRQGSQFVGGDTADLGRFVGALTGAQTNPNASMGLRDTQREDANNSRSGLGMSGQTQKRYRTIRSVDFEYPALAAPAVSSTLARRFQVSPDIQRMGKVQVETQGRTAILRGEVPTARDRVVAEKLALLEVGISAVQNELTVAAPLATPE